MFIVIFPAYILNPVGKTNPMTSYMATFNGPVGHLTAVKGSAAKTIRDLMAVVGWLGRKVMGMLFSRPLLIASRS